MNLFLAWCQLNRAHPLPASVADVTRFIRECSHLSADVLHAELVAIDEQHAELLYSEPGKSRHVIEAFNAAHPINPPRSWPADKKALFAELPYSIKLYLRAREDERDQVVRDAQNEAGELRNKLKRLESKNAETKNAA
jgi:hypothetical protein